MSTPDSSVRSSATGFTRVVVTGSESAGKTTLSQLLADELGAVWVPEYARIYAESVQRELTEHDVAEIAHGQIDVEDAALASDPLSVVQDTDLISTVVYARHYYGACPEWIVDAARHRVASIYLLCDIDIPWVEDGVRDRPLDRKLLDSLFRQTLAEFDANVAPVSGLGAHRLRNALKLISDWQALPR